MYQFHYRLERFSNTNFFVIGGDRPLCPPGDATSDHWSMFLTDCLQPRWQVTKAVFLSARKLENSFEPGRHFGTKLVQKMESIPQKWTDTIYMSLIIAHGAIELFWRGQSLACRMLFQWMFVFQIELTKSMSKVLDFGSSCLKEQLGLLVWRYII